MIFAAGESIKYNGANALVLDELAAWFRGYCVRRKNKLVFTKSTPVRRVKERDGLTYVAIGDGNGKVVDLSQHRSSHE